MKAMKKNKSKIDLNFEKGDWIHYGLKQTEISETYIKDFYDRLSLKKYTSDGKFKVDYARRDWLVFATYMCGMTGDTQIKLYQAYLIDAILENKRVAVVKARQLGMSTILGIFSLWAALFNVKPVGIDKTTVVGIISKDDDSAKALLRKYIRGSWRMFKDRMRSLGWDDNIFQSIIGDLDNASQLSFSRTIGGGKNGSIICSYPPTEKAVGESFSFLIIDEAALLKNPNPDEWIAALLPTMAKTNGHICYSSTPRGASGFYYDAIDPFDKKQDHNFERLFFPYIINKDDEGYMRQVYEDFMFNMDYTMFRREYCCDFVLSGSNFFNPIKVDEAIDEFVADNYKGQPVSIAIDFGWNESRTVVTVVFKDDVDDALKLIEYKRFDAHTNSSTVINYIKHLKTLYNIVNMTADNCIQGKDFFDLTAKEGWIVREFDFHTQKGDKIPTYTKFRNMLHTGYVRIPKDQLLLKELKELMIEETQSGLPSIHKPRGGSDDIVDSLIMACSIYLIDENSQIYGEVF